MGNFSRDPKSRIKAAVSKHYSSVRLQQGVPLLDADWNEMEGLLRYKSDNMGRLFIGDGVPSGDDGFRILENNNDNDFTVKKGIILVNGKDVVNDNDCTYRNQPFSVLVGELPSPDDTTYIVYLDTWEEEYGSQKDEELIDERIGIETCVRLKRLWVVRVIEADNPEQLPPEPEDHNYCPLAKIKRIANNSKISFNMIDDLRRIHLTLANTAKAPLQIFDKNGNPDYQLENFSILLDDTKKIYFDLMRSDLFMNDYFNSATPYETVTISSVFNNIMQTANVAFLQAMIKNLNNHDGIRVLETLYYAQDNFVNAINSLIEGSADDSLTKDLLDEMREFLNGELGLKEAVITKKDLKSGIKIQQDIIIEIGNRMDKIPHGNILIKFIEAPAVGTIIEKGNIYSFGFEIIYEKTTTEPWEETFDIRSFMNPVGWNATIDGQNQTEIFLRTGETKKIQVDIEIPADTTLSDSSLEFNVRSQHNPYGMNETNSDVILVNGSVCPQPVPLHIELIYPAELPEGIEVGRGGPVGVPGKGINLGFKFLYSEIIQTPESFTVSFQASPEDTFTDIQNHQFELGASAGSETEIGPIGFQCSADVDNGTEGLLTIHMEKDSEPGVYYEKEIKLIVNKH